MEVVSHNGKKILLKVVDDHVLEEATDHDEIRLKGFDLNFLNEDKKEVSREGPNEFPYLLILINICTED